MISFQIRHIKTKFFWIVFCVPTNFYWVHQKWRQILSKNWRQKNTSMQEYNFRKEKWYYSFILCKNMRLKYENISTQKKEMYAKYWVLHPALIKIINLILIIINTIYWLRPFLHSIKRLLSTFAYFCIFLICFVNSY